MVLSRNGGRFRTGDSARTDPAPFLLIAFRAVGHRGPDAAWDDSSVFSEQQIRDRVGESEALDAARRAFTALARGAVRQPPAISLQLPEWSGELAVKAVYLDGAAIFAVKMDTGFGRNPERGLPRGSGLIVLFSATTGQPLSVLADNGYLTELRTGAAGALAADLLGPASLETVGVLGTGSQARYQIRALAGICKWVETRAWSPNPERVAQFCAEMWEETGIPCHASASPRDVVSKTQLLYTVTPSTEPLVQSDWLQAGATVIAVGADAPHKQELHADVLRSADKVVPDDWSRAMRVGELHHAVAGGLSLRRVHGELGKVMTGERPGREGDEIIVCDLTGLPAQDAAIAEAAWNRLRSVPHAG